MLSELHNEIHNFQNVGMYDPDTCYIWKCIFLTLVVVKKLLLATYYKLAYMHFEAPYSITL